MCVAGAEVEIDPDTGVVTVLRTSTIADVGKAINPQLVERQDEGATCRESATRCSRRCGSSTAEVANDNLLEYRIPRIADLPREMTSIIVENEDGPGPYGAKGCGEGAFAAVPAAIVCALADAGVPMNELPLTPERVWRRIQELSNSTLGQGSEPDG